MAYRLAIEVKLDLEGLHQWQECPINEVSYLKYLHRHRFVNRARRQVSHEQRDVEFIEFKHQLEGYLKERYYDSQYKCLNFGNLSCESIARDLFEQFKLERCSVSEDDEFTSIITRKCSTK